MSLCTSFQAQEDSDMLKSVVVPLEKEIKLLKAKLEVAETKISERSESSKQVSECMFSL